MDQFLDDTLPAFYDKFKENITQDETLVLPGRLQWENLLKNDIYEALGDVYETNLKMKEDDRLLISLLSLTRPREAELINLLLSRVYRTMEP